MATPIDSRIRLFLGDITSLDCDVIVTAANDALCGGGGVDGAVHDAAGPELVRASMALAPCPAGDAKITNGFDLNARFVIHAVGPIFTTSTLTARRSRTHTTHRFRWPLTTNLCRLLFPASRLVHSGFQLMQPVKLQSKRWFGGCVPTIYLNW